MKYFEDFEIGERRSAGSYRVTREEMIEFAERYDPQLFHTDEAVAKASIFGGLTACSGHTFSLMGLMYSRSPEEIALVSNLGAESLRFPNPIRPGDEVTLSSECVEVRASRSRPTMGIVKTLAKMTNQRGESVMEMQSAFMVMRREGGG